MKVILTIFLLIFKLTNQLEEIFEGQSCKNEYGCFCTLKPNIRPRKVFLETIIQAECKFSSLCIVHKQKAHCFESNLVERVCKQKGGCLEIFEPNEDYELEMFYLSFKNQKIARTDPIKKIKIGMKCFFETNEKSSEGCMCMFGQKKTDDYVYSFGIYVSQMEKCELTDFQISRMRLTTRSWQCQLEKCICNVLKSPCKKDEFCITAGPNEYCSKVDYFTPMLNNQECKNFQGCYCSVGDIHSFNSKFDLCTHGTVCEIDEVKKKAICKGPKFSDECPQEEKFCFCSDHEVASPETNCLYFKHLENSSRKIRVGDVCNLEGGCRCFEPGALYIPVVCALGETCQNPDINVGSLMLSVGTNVLSGVSFGLSEKLGLKDVDIMRCRLVGQEQYWKCQNLKSCYCGISSRKCQYGEYCLVGSSTNSCHSEIPLDKIKNSKVEVNREKVKI